MKNQRKKMGWGLFVPVFALVLSLFSALFSPGILVSAFSAADCTTKYANAQLQNICKEGITNKDNSTYCDKYSGGTKDACKYGLDGANGSTTTTPATPGSVRTFCAGKYTNAQLVAACEAGGTNTSDASYCSNNYSGGTKDACTAGYNSVNGTTNPNGPVSGVAAFCQGKYTNQQLIDACTKGGDQNNYGNDIYCDNYSGGTKDACVTGRDEARRLNSGWVNTTPATTPAGDGDTTCVIPYVGWAVCPILLAVSKGVDGAYNVVEGILETPVSIFTESDTNGVGEVYGKFLVVANIVLAVAFLIIIIATAIPGIMPNYTIKKFLPNLIIAALAINIAFYACAAVVDIVNIIGKSIPDFFSGLSAQNINQNVPSDWTVPVIGDATNGAVGGATGNANNFGDFTGSILAGTAVIGGIAIFSAGGLAPIGWAILMFLIPVVLGAIIAILAILLALVLRSALIIILIVISPLAFAALALPNTEKLFSKWFSLFGKLLLLYPIVALVFGGSKLAGGILMNVATTSSGTAVGAFLAMAASAATILPLILVPGIMKGAVSATGKLGQKIEGLADKGYSGAKGLADKRMKESGTGQYYSKKAETDKGLKAGGFNLGERKTSLRSMPNRRDWRRAHGTSISNKISKEYSDNYGALLDNNVADLDFSGQQAFLQTELAAATRSQDFGKAQVVMDKLAATGAVGLGNLKTTMRTNNIGYSNSTFDVMVRNHIGANKAAFIKDAQVLQLSRRGSPGFENVTLNSRVDVNALGMKDSEIASQTAKGIDLLDGITPARAAQILDDTKIDKQRDVQNALARIAGRPEI